jgi:hypothetical protein
MLARYSGNFFAKEFLPKSAGHLIDASSLGVEPSRVCIVCWHNQRQIVLEDEGHVLFECPHYAKPRSDYFSELSDGTSEGVRKAASGSNKFLRALESSVPADWVALGRFAARIRQLRRSLRQRFDSRTLRLTKTSFPLRRIAWRSTGRFVCRHGVFFRSRPANGCACLTPDLGDWTDAVFMTAIDDDLKAIVTVKFDISCLSRLGVVQARLRRNNW